jgi:hypothetical protein
MTSEKKSFLLGQLQEAIDAAVTESARVGDIIEEMKRGGYDLCLMLESTVTISPLEDSEAPAPQAALNGEFKLTEEDLEFLQELNIAG